MGARATGPVVPTPLGRRLQQLRHRAAPVAVWCLAVICLAGLAQRNFVHLSAIGLVELHEVPIAPVETGLIKGLNVDLFEPVKAGQVVVLMDDAVIQGELSAAEAELTRLRADVDGELARFRMETTTLERDVLNDQRRFALAEEEARLDQLDRMIEQEVNSVSLQWMESIMRRQELMAKEHIVDQTTYDETRLRYEALKKQVAEGQLALAAAESRVKEAAQLREAESARQDLAPSEDQVLQPLRAALDVQHAVISEIQARRKTLAIVSPVDGHVAAIWLKAGATAVAGQPILTIASGDASRVVAYVPEHTARAVSVGTPVRVQSRSAPNRVATAEVIKVSPQIAVLPLHLQPNLNTQQWGLPLLIGQLPDGFVPGEIVDVTLMETR